MRNFTPCPSYHLNSFQEAEKNKISKKVTLRELFSNRQLRQPLLIAMVVMVAQQFSGINAVIFFSTDIFTRVRLTTAQSQYATLGKIPRHSFLTICRQAFDRDLTVLSDDELENVACLALFGPGVKSLV